MERRNFYTKEISYKSMCFKIDENIDGCFSPLINKYSYINNIRKISSSNDKCIKLSKLDDVLYIIKDEKNHTKRDAFLDGFKNKKICFYDFKYEDLPLI